MTSRGLQGRLKAVNTISIFQRALVNFSNSDNVYMSKTQQLGAESPILGTTIKG